MPKFSPLSLSRLSTCHPDLQTLFNEVILIYDCLILCGHRDKADQDAAFAAGTSKLKYPYGNHNAIPSNAVDVLPWPKPDWKNVGDFIFFAGHVCAIAKILYNDKKITHAITWGGDWDRDEKLSNNRFNDLVHYEILE